MHQRGLRRHLSKETPLVQFCTQWDAPLAGGVLCGKQTLSQRDVPRSVFTKSSSIVHKSRER